jgi:N-succinyldiaminopimelate aminotransferase
VTRVPHLSARLQGFGTTVFAEMSALAVATGSVNLGQGFPDYPGPPEVLEIARAAIGTAHDQYPPGPGLPELRTAISAHVQRFRGLSYDPDAEVLVTAGAT